MRYQKIFFLIALLSTTSLYSQEDKKYNKELKIFMTFVRDSVFKNEDTLFTRNYLSNKELFGGTVLNRALYPKDDLFTQDEIKFIAKKIDSDTIKFYLSPNILKQSLFVSDDASNIFKLSKPIFYRNFEFCIFSFAITKLDTQKTHLYKKENGAWRFFKNIGGVYNY